MTTETPSPEWWVTIYEVRRVATGAGPLDVYRVELAVPYKTPGDALAAAAGFQATRPTIPTPDEGTWFSVDVSEQPGTDHRREPAPVWHD